MESEEESWTMCNHGMVLESVLKAEIIRKELLILVTLTDYHQFTFNSSLFSNSIKIGDKASLLRKFLIDKLRRITRQLIGTFCCKQQAVTMIRDSH